MDGRHKRRFRALYGVDIHSHNDIHPFVDTNLNIHKEKEGKDIKVKEVKKEGKDVKCQPIVGIRVQFGNKELLHVSYGNGEYVWVQGGKYEFHEIMKSLPD